MPVGAQTRYKYGKPPAYSITNDDPQVVYATVMHDDAGELGLFTAVQLERS